MKAALALVLSLGACSGSTPPPSVAPSPSPSPVVAPAVPAPTLSDDERRKKEEEALALSALMTSDDSPAQTTGDMNSRRPGSGTHARDSDPSRPSPPSGRISVSSKHALDTTTLTEDVVLAKMMAAYMAGLKRCYREQLGRDAASRGRETLSFTVNQTGRVTSPAVTGLSPELDGCISTQVLAWRFPLAKNDAGDVVEARFEIVFQLVPE